MNTLKKALDSRGLTYLEASKMGVNYQTLRKQYLGERSVGLKSAKIYEKVLGIPKEELRPDIWTPIPATPDTPSAPEGGEARG